MVCTVLFDEDNLKKYVRAGAAVVVQTKFLVTKKFVSTHLKIRHLKWYKGGHGKPLQLSAVRYGRPVLRPQGNPPGFNRDQYEQLMLTLSTSQKKLLIALAHERTDEFGDAYRRRHALGVSSTVNSAKAKLMEDGHVELYDGRYTIADPFLHSISAWREAMPGFNDGLQKIGCFPCARGMRFLI